MPPTAPATSRGSRVARRRIARGYTQEELARLCGCSVRTIIRIEGGLNPNTSQRLIRALHRRLGMPLAELVSGQAETKRA